MRILHVGRYHAARHEIGEKLLQPRRRDITGTRRPEERRIGHVT